MNFGSILFAMLASAIHHQMRKQTTFVVYDGEKGLIKYVCVCTVCFSRQFD